jgi:hypothetical protein
MPAGGVGDDVLYSRYFYVNNGHGGSDDGWALMLVRGLPVASAR